MKSAKSDLVEGGVYSFSDEGGAYGVAKILKIDAGGYHLRLYGLEFSRRPGRLEPRTLARLTKDDDMVRIGHLPVAKESIGNWGLRFIAASAVLESELDGYNFWLESDDVGYVK